MKLTRTLALAAALFAASLSMASAETFTKGIVKKIDAKAGKVTIIHEELVDLDMPAMTMVFQVKEPAMLEQVKAGDKVKFEAQKLGGAFTVTRIEAAK